jgi:two-component system, OmpR family, response regulator ResD
MTLPGEPTKRVLIVDDEESMRLLLQRVVQSIAGIETTLADSGDSAVSLATGRSFDLILMDLLMPGLGGIEALTRIRRSSISKATPVIIVSVIADPDTRIVCSSLGVKDFVVKPIQREALLQAVRRALG